MFLFQGRRCIIYVINYVNKVKCFSMGDIGIDRSLSTQGVDFFIECVTM